MKTFINDIRWRMLKWRLSRNATRRAVMLVVQGVKP